MSRNNSENLIRQIIGEVVEGRRELRRLRAQRDYYEARLIRVRNELDRLNSNSVRPVGVVGDYDNILRVRDNDTERDSLGESRDNSRSNSSAENDQVNVIYSPVRVPHDHGRSIRPQNNYSDNFSDISSSSSPNHLDETHGDEWSDSGSVTLGSRDSSVTSTPRSRSPLSSRSSSGATSSRNPASSSAN